jgi:hypothetical protein
VSSTGNGHEALLEADSYLERVEAEALPTFFDA